MLIWEWLVDPATPLTYAFSQTLNGQFAHCSSHVSTICSRHEWYYLKLSLPKKQFLYREAQRGALMINVIRN